MTAFVVYDDVTREVLRITTYETPLESNEKVLMAENPPLTACYIEDGVIKERPEQPDEDHEWNVETKQWVQSLDNMAGRLRRERNALLRACDWTQLPDVPLKTKTAWAAYRQALRDITEQPSFPADVEWPKPPD